MPQAAKRGLPHGFVRFWVLFFLTIILTCSLPLFSQVSPPVINSLSPSSAVAGGADFNLIVNGAGFIGNDADFVLWNGFPRFTVFVNSTQLRAVIRAADIAAAGTANITAHNAVTGLSSAPVSFTINNPVPSISSISPNSVVAGSGATTLAVNGSNFVSSSAVRWNGSNRPTTFVSKTQLQAAIPASDLAAAGSAAVTVNTPSPGGGTSDTATFTIRVPRISVAPTGLNFGDVLVGTAATRSVMISNQEATPVPISAGTSAGSPFSVASQMFTIPGGGSVALSITFIPPAEGNYEAIASFVIPGSGGQQLVGLSGRGVSLSYQYTVAGQAPVLVSPGGTISFPSVTAGASNSLQFQVSNPSGSAFLINTISSSSSLFTFTDLPALPTSVPAGGSLAFAINFTPLVPASHTGTLTVGARTFALTGIGLVAGATISGLADTVPPAEQPKASVDLSSPYPIPLTGQLQISFTSNADVPSDDPSIQFSSGGRVASFTIPANSTKAQFAGAPEIAFSSGTVSGTIRLTATLQNEATDVTPPMTPTRTVSIERRAPAITNVSIASRTAAGFELAVTGYSTPRSLTQATFSFTPRPGSTVPTGLLNVDVGAPFTTWYQSMDSQPFGSQFRLRVPFTVQGDINAIGSVSVTLTNAAGTSTAMSANF
jgi:hypothetical protein